MYRWDFVAKTLSAALNLQPPTGEAYTPTLIGPEGAVYAINNAMLFCCVSGTGRIGPHGQGRGVLLHPGVGLSRGRSLMRNGVIIDQEGPETKSKR